MDRIINVPQKRVNLWKDRWIWRLAWKDALKNRSRLLLFISSIVTGIAAFVAVLSFNTNLRNDIDNQAKALLGADLVLYNDESFQAVDSLFFDSLENEQASDARFNSMVRFPYRNETRLVQVVAIQGDYPFYGDLETLPEQALASFRQQGFALLDDHLAFQHEISTDDTLRIGKLAIIVAGIVTKMPGNVRIMSNLSPSVYIPLHALQETGLLGKGSRISYRKFFRCLPDETPESLLQSLRPTVNEFGLGYETVAYRKESLGSSFENLYRFLNLAAFIALIVGSVGVAGAVHVYTREKHKIIAILRCLGAQSSASFYIFFIQVAALGLVGSVIGALLGNGLQNLLPFILRDFLPLELSLNFSWLAFGVGIGAGLAITLLFSSLPMINLGQISPLSALRRDAVVYRQPYRWKLIIVLLILLSNWGFTVYLTSDMVLGSAFFAGFVMALILLFIVAWLLLQTLKLLINRRFPFVWRQGFYNLYRPQNQTMLLVMVIGLGALLIALVSVTQSGILKQVDRIGRQNQANLVLYDVQPDQKEQIEGLIANQNITVQDFIPIVTMRISKINGRTPSELQADSVHGMIPNWLLYLEHPTTYRSHLLETEKLLAGSFPPVTDFPSDSIPVSVTETAAEKLKLQLGDRIDFNLHGSVFTAYVRSIRKIDWQQIPTNFAFVFPEGVLEEVPKFYAVLLYAPSPTNTANFKQRISLNAPNISIIDLNLILRTVNQVMAKAAFIIRFVSLFSIISGLLILVTSILNTKYARLKENALLRTLGAKNRQLGWVALIEYGYIGFLSSLAGVLLSIGATQALSGYFLEIVLLPDYGQLVKIVALLTGVTVLVSYLNIRTVLVKSPIEVLREEG